MIARRGLSMQIYSDNGTNLRGANEELKNAITDLDETKLKQTLTVKGIEWHFIPPSAPHTGGAWERMVRSIKQTFYVILHGQNIKDEVLLTLLTEAEGIINSRLLTHVSVDPDDPKALTPNHFLLGSSSGWVKEYPPTLTCRKKWKKNAEPTKISDVVIVYR
jgi:hypothetical protein